MQERKMKLKLMSTLFILIILTSSFYGKPLYASGNNEIYVYPPITDNKILPTSSIPSEYISNNISIIGSPGEYLSATFVLKPSTNITSLNVSVSDLISTNATMSSSAIDIRVVKCWYQAGNTVSDVSHKTLTPELLLKDDSLVKVENGENYVKLTNGSYKWISDPTIPAERSRPIPNSEMPIQDSATLQPVDILANTNKQFWVTAHIPETASAGNYTGSITLSVTGNIIATLQLKVSVLAINLKQPMIGYDIWYSPRLWLVPYAGST